jgi:hypothetical protein
MISSHEYSLKLRNDDFFLYKEVKRISKKLQVEENFHPDDSIQSSLTLLSYGIHNEKILSLDEIHITYQNLLDRFYSYIEGIEE